MSEHSDKAPRTYTLRITRSQAGFGWAIYDGQRAKPVLSGVRQYASFGEASSWGELALSEMQKEDKP